MVLGLDDHCRRFRWFASEKESKENTTPNVIGGHGTIKLFESVNTTTSTIACPLLISLPRHQSTTEEVSSPVKDVISQTSASENIKDENFDSIENLSSLQG